MVIEDFSCSKKSGAEDYWYASPIPVTLTIIRLIIGRYTIIHLAGIIHPGGCLVYFKG